MPTYEYVCRNCGNRLEVVQSFHDDALTVCPSCSGELKKVFGSVGIVFKGSGFYKNDSRNATSSVTPPGSSDAKSDSTPSESSKPAKASTSSDASPTPSAPATTTPTPTP
jgi:putative FmdB family regulatory protein